MLSVVMALFIVYHVLGLVSRTTPAYALILKSGLFSVGGPLAGHFTGVTHAVHGVAAPFVIFGLYDPVHNDLRKDEWARILLREPSELRHPGEWMVPMDDEILELFHSAHPVLTLAINAFNLDRSREQVNRRLSELESRDLIEWVECGKYWITTLGEEYLQGELAPYRPETAG